MINNDVNCHLVLYKLTQCVLLTAAARSSDRLLFFGVMTRVVIVIPLAPLNLITGFGIRGAIGIRTYSATIRPIPFTQRRNLKTGGAIRSVFTILRTLMTKTNCAIEILNLIIIITMVFEGLQNVFEL